MFASVKSGDESWATKRGRQLAEAYRERDVAQETLVKAQAKVDKILLGGKS